MHAHWVCIRGRRLGVAFRRQAPLLGPFIADFLAPSVRLIVEVDGASHRKTERRDAHGDAVLVRARYRVIRLYDGGCHGACALVGMTSHQPGLTSRELARRSSGQSALALVLGLGVGESEPSVLGTGAGIGCAARMAADDAGGAEGSCRPLVVGAGA